MGSVDLGLSKTILTLCVTATSTGEGSFPAATEFIHVCLIPVWPCQLLPRLQFETMV